VTEGEDKTGNLIEAIRVYSCEQLSRELSVMVNGRRSAKFEATW